MTKKINIRTTPDYALEPMVEIVRDHFLTFELDKKLQADTRVLIKPNLLMKRTPEEFTTTHPTLVEAAIICLKEFGVKQIVVADSPGGTYTEHALKGIYRTSGMEAVCARQQVTLNQDVTSFERVNEQNKVVRRFPLITPIAQADFILDICKLKSHAMTGLSGAVKNMFGSIPGLTKPEFHWRFPEKELFCEMLVDLCQTVKPDFALVDAVDAMEGDKRHVGLTLASDNLYELDYYLCQLIGTDPNRIYTVKAAMARGLCDGKVQLTGDAVAPIQPFIMPHDKGVDFMGHTPKLLRKPAKWITTHLLTSKPVIHTSACIGCGKCAESCPPQTIAIQDRKAVIDYKQCIRCFCCHEMCPIKVIDIKRSVLFSSGTKSGGKS